MATTIELVSRMAGLEGVHCSLIFCVYFIPQSIGKHSVVRELSIYAGRLLLFFHCSPQVSYATLLNLIRGMAATGMKLRSLQR